MVKKAIQKKIGTLKNYADIKNIGKGAMSERIKNLSDKFIYELEQEGILIDNSNNLAFNSGGNQKNN